MKILITGNPKFLIKKYSFAGAHIFSENLLDYVKTTPNQFTGLLFQKPTEDSPQNFDFTTHRKGQNKWLVLHAKITTAEILSLVTKKPSKIALALVDQTAELLKSEKADVFVLNGFSAMVYVLLQAAHKAGLPIVSIHHGLWFKETQALTKLIPKSSFHLRRKLESDTVLLAKKNVFLNLETLKEFEKNVIKVPKNQLEIIPLPLDTKYLNSKLPKTKPHHIKPVIAIIGRWDRIKNHDGFLKLALAAKKAKLDWEFKAVTSIGKYPAYDNIADKYQKHIQIIPQMIPSKLKRFIQNCNLIVVPSRFETFSAVVMEGLLQNRPVVISPNIPWVNTYKKFGLSHWVAPFDNPQKTIKLIKQALAQQPPAKLIKYIENTHKSPAIFNKYLKTFKSAIK